MLSYKEIEDSLLHEVPNGYKLEGYLHDHNMSLKDFVKEFILNFNFKYPTVTNNPVVNHVICREGKSRTMSDIFLISKYYYPDASFKEIRQTLIDEKSIELLKCYVVEDIVANPPEQYSMFNGSSVWKTSKKDRYGYCLTDKIPD